MPITVIKDIKEILEFIDQTPDLKSQQDLLKSIPSISKITAARLLAEIGDIIAFEGAPQLAACAGLNPKSFRSGSSVHKKLVSQSKVEPNYAIIFLKRRLGTFSFWRWMFVSTSLHHN